jgi:hypothetical protein
MAQVLLKIVVEPESEKAMNDQGSPAKVALYCLGNMANHRECAEPLMAMGVSSILLKLQGCRDPIKVKHAQRLASKLQYVQ